MSTVRGQIYDAVVAAIEAVPEVFAVVKGPTRDTSIGTKAADSQCAGKCVLEVFLGADDVTPASQGWNKDELWMNVTIACHLGVAAALDTSSLEDRACTLLGKVYTAMMADPTFGGIARDTRIEMFSTGVVEDDRPGVGTWAAAQSYSVKYAFPLGDPSTSV